MKLSLIIVNYRQAAEIKEMLSRVTVPADDVEIIVVDDRSDDPDLDALESWMGATFAHAKVVRCRSKVHVGGARNVGAKEAVGEWLWFVDGDDAVCPDAVTRVVDAIGSARDVDCLVLDYTIESDGSSETVSFSDCRPADQLKLWGVGIMAWFKVIRREAFVEFRVDSSEDNDWWVRQCIELISRRNGREEYGTVDGGPCYAYRSFGPGAFTTALRRFSKAEDPGSAVRALFKYPDTASNVAAVLRMLAEMVSLTTDLRKSQMPAAFVEHHDFVLRWWFDRIAKIGGAR